MHEIVEKLNSKVPTATSSSRYEEEILNSLQDSPVKMNKVSEAKLRKKWSNTWKKMKQKHPLNATLDTSISDI